MKCPFCEADIQPGWVACPACGNKLLTQCPQCGAEVEPGWKACPMCGAALTAAGPEPSPAGAQLDLDATVAKEVAQDATGPGGAAIRLDSSVAKSVTQDATGPGGATIEAKDSVVGDIKQSASIGATECAAPSADLLKQMAQQLEGAAKVEVKDGVVKHLEQKIIFNFGGMQSLDALFAHQGAGGLKTRLIYAACGREILAYNPASQYRETEPVSVYTLPEPMGGVRSVRLAKLGSRLMILAGARCGVVIFDGETAAASVYPFPNPTQYGANAATIHGDFLYATHSDLGLLRWPIAGGEPQGLFPELFGAAATVRGVQVSLEGQLVLCAGSSVYRVHLSDPEARPAEYPAPGAGALVGAVECSPFLFAASSDGQVFGWRRDLPGRPERQLASRGPKTYSLALAQMPDGPHLVVGAKRPFLRTIKLAPPRANVDYATPSGIPVRWARAAADLAVATGGEYRRLFVWRKDNVDKPELDIPVARGPKARVMDICLLSQ